MPHGASREPGEARQQYVFDQMEAMTSEDGLQADERMRDSIGSAGSVLLASAWADESEEEEDEGGGGGDCGGGGTYSEGHRVDRIRLYICHRRKYGGYNAA
jgi:hypothetical protein